MACRAFFGATRRIRAPKFARCSKSSGVFCFTCSAGGFTAHAFLKSTFTDFGGGGLVQAVGTALRSLVSPQCCTTTCFDVCLIMSNLHAAVWSMCGIRDRGTARHVAARRHIPHE
jgi:hypothetical protein